MRWLRHHVDPNETGEESATKKEPTPSKGKKADTEDDDEDAGIKAEGGDDDF